MIYLVSFLKFYEFRLPLLPYVYWVIASFFPQICLDLLYTCKPYMLGVFVWFVLFGDLWGWGVHVLQSGFTYFLYNLSC